MFLDEFFFFFSNLDESVPYHPVHLPHASPLTCCLNCNPDHKWSRVSLRVSESDGVATRTVTGVDDSAAALPCHSRNEQP